MARLVLFAEPDFNSGYLFGVSVFVVRIKVLSGGTYEVKCLRLFQSLYDNNIFSEEKNVF